MSPTTVTYVGGPTAILQYAGLRIVTDPTFDSPRDYPAPGATTLVKTAGPGVALEDVGHVDVVLLSHHAHKDNLDFAGLKLLSSGVRAFSTPAAAAELTASEITGLRCWQQAAVGPVTVTALPALHGPPGAERFAGTVTGFMLEAEGEPRVYVSGDNASLALVEEIAERFDRIDIALIFAGAANTPILEGNLTFSAADAARAAAILGADRVIVLHAEDWEHFSEGPDAVESAFGELPGYVRTPRGEPVTL